MSAPIPRAATSSAGRKPRVALALATAFGLGYLPIAPGTWGSLGGILIATSPLWFTLVAVHVSGGIGYAISHFDPLVLFQCYLAGAIALVGLWSAHRAAKFWGIKDPQQVVIDEVSGQQLALLLGGFWPLRAQPSGNPWNNLNSLLYWKNHPLGLSMFGALNWKYFLLGFILFRVFDIWKPFPARQAESLPGGLGIMADDWIAGIYAALGLWLARLLGL